jgi:hypothetical protein
MPKIKYVDKAFRQGALDIIDKANEIIAEYEAQGFKLTLRQLYYQFVARDIIPNKQSEYKRLGGIISDGRLAGLIDWFAIEDRTRNLQSLSTWSSPEDIIGAASSGYREDKWKDQLTRVEVWIEKDALAGVFADVCEDLEVPYFSCRGYTSQSEMWSAAMRLRRYERNGQQTVILHFGDHDPSGIDMSRDIKDRLYQFHSDVDVRRIALSMDQIEQYNPPPNPAKEIDPRFVGYQEQYGNESWELDALEPSVLADLVREHVDTILDQTKWEDSLDHEKTNKDRLTLVKQNWEMVATYAEETYTLDEEDDDK